MTRTLAATASATERVIPPANLEDAAELQNLAAADNAEVPVAARQQQIEQRLCSTDKLMNETHQMLQGMGGSSMNVGHVPTVVNSNVTQTGEGHVLLARESGVPVGGAVAGPSAAPVTGWHKQIERRMDKTEKLMQDMHQMLQGVGGIGHVHRTVMLAPAQTAAQCPPPWPTAEGLLSGELRPGALDSLPANVRGRILGFSASSLPVYAHVSEK